MARSEKSSEEAQTPQTTTSDHGLGGVGYYFKIPLVFCKQKQKLNSKGYLEIFKKQSSSKNTLSRLFKGKKDDWAVLQDNATCHKTKSLMGYLGIEAPYYVRDYRAYLLT